MSLCLSGDGLTVAYLLEALCGLSSTGLIFQVHFSEVEEVQNLPGFSGDPLRPNKDCISWKLPEHISYSSVTRAPGLWVILQRVRPTVQNHLSPFITNVPSNVLKMWAVRLYYRQLGIEEEDLAIKLKPQSCIWHQLVTIIIDSGQRALFQYT